MGCKSINQKGTVKNGGGITQKDALVTIKEELAGGKVCGVKLATGGIYGHTVVCSGVREGISLEDAIWEDLLFNDVGRGSSTNREAKTYDQMSYDDTTYSVPSDGNCCVITDTTK